MAELPLVGDEFAGYRVRSVLGRGGMSVVYQAENLRRAQQGAGAPGRQAGEPADRAGWTTSP